MDARRRAALLVLAAALCLAGHARAADVRTEVPSLPPGPLAPSAVAAPPSIPVASGLSPRLSQPSQLAPAAAPEAAAAPAAASPDPRAADAPRPADASAGLKAVAASVQKENARPAAEAAPSPAARAFFDGGVGKAVRATAVLASAATPGGLGMPAAYALQKYAVERGRRPAPEPAPLRRRVLEYVDPHLGIGAAAFVGLIARSFASGAGAAPWVLALVAAGAAFGAARGAEQLLAQSRREVVGGWQASHDQKYRVDPGTGRLRDVRGHKYGSDRYEEFEDGAVSAGERLWLRAAATGMGALLLSSGSGPAALLFGASLTGLFAASDLLERLRPKPHRVYSDEDREHAARFRPSSSATKR